MLTTTLRVMVVDDVLLARQRLERLLRDVPGIVIVASCEDAIAALQSVVEARPDVLLLDVEMPEVDGFALLERLPSNTSPEVIFVTAYDQHAVRAFEVHAVDYLLKPIETQRLHAALDRVRRRIEARAPTPGRLLVRDADTTHVLSLAEIDWIESAGNYLCIRSHGRTYVQRCTLSEMEGRLDPRRYQRIHRSRIVNVDRIARLTPQSNGDHIVVLHDGTELALSRTYRDPLLSRLRSGSLIVR